MSSPFAVLSRREVIAPAEDELAKKREQLREARLNAARNQPNWREVSPAARLIPRGPARFGWLCDAADDSLWRVTRGATFQPGSAVVVATHTAVTFYVDTNGDVVALEPAPIKTWSEVVRRRPDLVRAS